MALAIFNLLPIPPLDGSRIVDGLIPFTWRGVWNRVSSAGTLLLMAMFIAPQLMGFGLGGMIAGLSARLAGR